MDNYAGDQIMSIARMVLEGGMKLVGGTVRNAGALLATGVKVAYDGKTRQSLSRFARSDKPHGWFKLSREDFTKFARSAKTYRIHYAIAHDRTRKDGLIPVMFYNEDAANIQKIIESEGLALVGAGEILPAENKTQTRTAAAEQTEELATELSVDGADLDVISSEEIPIDESLEAMLFPTDAVNPTQPGKASQTFSGELPQQVNERSSVLGELRDIAAEQSDESVSVQTRSDTRVDPEMQRALFPELGKQPSTSIEKEDEPTEPFRLNSEPTASSSPAPAPAPAMQPPKRHKKTDKQP